ncbi:ATP-binding cassette domain-containing protein [Rhodococcus opacus]|uniref:ABC transporter ATP-binding/permease protein n=1 Tax=Rhodococcus opacus TaxID=37919 RepID=A0A1B1K013_RHOOP|nr:MULTISPECIES: ATP-binding cassette domain-containing protein [Rhodococcus]ANS25917.1 ABC transporter ATP-binding/permease protein [Rhodococcus opacus]MBA8958803.1 ABC-type multidrug transport system ATPase subunit [Rhodococcus opacus]MBP2204368.1 ABC-type multidrug transport system ATPase subunit/pSer/pThr/pTyr-binding forkhead associated (FHA) protein [Rhodococcus opacus]MCZ4585121.1 ATP-binding cassette domain-containing protein [Rhodococcus opacus]MDI9937284.1 ATP-binding cassette domain
MDDRANTAHPRVVVETEHGRTSYGAGKAVRIGRDPQLEITIVDPVVSREHARLTWDEGWQLVDSGSKNGIYVDGARREKVSVTNPVVVRLGDAAEGPVVRISVEDPDATRQDVGARWDESTIGVGAPSAPPPTPHEAVPKGSLTVGRSPDNDIVVRDVLASRHHAIVHNVTSGLEIDDLGSVNGTFVGGIRVSRAQLTDGDVVTIGNTDFSVQEGRLVPRQAVAPTAGGLRVDGVGLTIEGGRRLLEDVTFTAQPGSLTAVIGPSGAGKTTVATIISGSERPTEGVVEFEGRSVHAEYQVLRSRIGMVPQDDVVHRQLTIRQALGYAAELRLPPDTSRTDREEVIETVLDELQLSEHADTRVDRLSGGQRKRASVAMELLTGPSLLILDEPTSGLDPALDRQIMATLRRLADSGRVVVIVTHSLSYLEMCDQVLLLAPGGKTAYVGPPDKVGAALGSTDWADIFARVAADPDGVFAEYRATRPAVEVPPPSPPGPLGSPAHTSRRKQLSTVVRRQARLIRADRGYLIFLSLLPFVLGGLAVLVPGDTGFGPSGLDESGELTQILVVLILGAAFMGCSLTIRDLVGERMIYHRERAAGLLPSAYLTAKIVVFCAAAIVQSVIMVMIVFVGKGFPGRGSVIPSGSVELIVDIAVTTCSCVLVGLALSSVARSNEQVMPMLVVTIMVQLVMCGGLITITGRAVLEQVSWLFPSRWGFAAAASTVDLRTNATGTEPDTLWQHTASWWLLNIAMLVLISCVLAVVTYSRLRLRRPRRR